jgi:tetratricopeptide (TPR) repeat protein
MERAMKSRCAPVLPCLLLLFLSAACGGSDVNLNQAPATGETRAERDAAVREAFTEAPADNPASEKVTTEIQTVFDQLTRFGNNRDSARAMKLIKLDLMLTVALQAFDVKATSLEFRQIINEADKTVRQTWFRPDDGTFDWYKSRVMRVQVSEDGNLALAYVRHQMDEYGNLDKGRWWLVRENGAWLIYDWEYVTTGMRLSRTWGAALSASSGPIAPRWITGPDYIGDARLQMNRGDYQAALATLKRGAGAGYPYDHEAVRLQYMSICHCELGEYEECLQVAEASLKLRPDFPEARLYRARGLHYLKRGAEALKEYEWYIDTLGSDPVAYSDLGACLKELGRLEEARHAYRASLRDIPLWHAIAGMAGCMEEDEMHELGDWFSRLATPREDYALLIAEVYHYVESNAATAAINEAYRKINPDDTELAWYTAMVALDAGDPQAAADALRPAISRAPKEERDVFQQRYWGAMAQAGKGVEALKEAGSTPEAFDFIARAAMEAWDGPGLRAICEAWLEGNETRPELHFYLGEAEFIEEAYARGETHFRKGLALCTPNSPHFAGLWKGLADCMQHQGRHLDAYKELNGRPDAFEFLAERLVIAEKADALEELIKLHEEKMPKHLVLPRFRGELAWLREDWKSAAAELETWFNKGKPGEDTPWYLLGRCVRASLRAGDVATAVQRAQRGLGERDLYLLVICHAVAGRPADAMKALDEYVAGDDDSARFRVTLLYDDEDAGERLRQPAYENLHKRFPIPEPEAAPEDE